MGIVRFQSIVGVAGGATRAALTQHQARRDNMADVSAKDGSQVSSLLIQDFLNHLKVHVEIHVYIMLLFLEIAL